jgi:hypothetical protein
VAAHVAGAGLVDDGGQLPEHVFGEGADVASDPRLDRDDLVANVRTSTRQPAKLALFVLGDEGDAPVELVAAHGERAPLGLDALLDQAGGLQTLAGRVLEQDAPALVGEEVLEVLDEGGQPALVAPAVERPLGRDGEDDGRGHEPPELLVHVGQGLDALVGRPDVGLGDDEHDLVARAGEQFVAEKDALALFDELPGVEQEEHRVAARNVIVRDVGPLQREVVDAGGVDEHDAVLEQARGVEDLEVLHLAPFGRAPLADGPSPQRLEVDRLAHAALAHRPRVRRLGVLDVVNDGGRRRHARRQHGAAEQRVDERGLAVVELAHHHQVEALALELGHVLFAHPRGDGLGAHALGDRADLAEQLDELGLAFVKQIERHGHPSTLMMS